MTAKSICGFSIRRMNMAEEKSSGFIGKVIGGVFAAIIAPIVVALAIKYSDRLFPATATAPGSPTQPVAAIQGGDKKPGGSTEPKGGSPRPGHAEPKATEHKVEPKPSEKRPGLITNVKLFNSVDLTGFAPVLKGQMPGMDPMRVFQVKDGLLHVSGEEQGALISDEEHENYHLIVEYRWGKPAEKKARNAGLLLHCSGPDEPLPPAVRCRITLPVNPANSTTGELEAVGAPGKVTLAGSIENKAGTTEKPVGELNKLECICDGAKITVRLNDKVISTAQVSPTRGKIAIQSLGSEISFKVIELQPLKK
jgi:hypothetical protein